MKEFTITQNDSGQRLDRFVAKAVPLLPTSLTQKYIRMKRIKVCGKGAKPDYKLQIGDTVQMYVGDEFFAATGVKNSFLKVTDHNLDIIYEDDNIILLNKPAGVLCYSTYGFDYSSLIARVQAYLSRKNEWLPAGENTFAPALCNRIDRNTSGIVIAAKNAESLRIINDKIKLREIDKYYLAVVHGVPNPSSGTLKGYISKDEARNLVCVSKTDHPGAKVAETEYRTVLAQDTTEANERLSAREESGLASSRLSLLECRLITGRTHQIRAQLADIGHPILGDRKYGSKHLNEPYNEPHQALCSYKMVFVFKTDAGPLSYLNGKSFELCDVPFVKKHFHH